MDACDARASSVPNRHRCGHLVRVGGQIAIGCDEIDSIDLECGSGHKYHENDDQDERGYYRPPRPIVGLAGVSPEEIGFS